MTIPDYISESLETIFWVYILKFFDADADSGSGNLLTPESGSGMGKIRIRDKYPGSVSLLAKVPNGFILGFKDSI
jgi:hypothetical protein